VADLPQDQFREAEQRQADRQRQKEVDDPEGDDRAYRTRSRQKQQHDALDHTQSAGHVAGQRGGVRQHVDRCRAGIGDVADRQQCLLQAGSDAGEVQRAETDLAERETHARHTEGEVPNRDRLP